MGGEDEQAGLRSSLRGGKRRKRKGKREYHNQLHLTTCRLESPQNHANKVGR